MSCPDDGSQGARPPETGGRPYQAPRLTLVGNLNDLLAGGGSKDSDSQSVCTGDTGAFVMPGGCN